MAGHYVMGNKSGTEEKRWHDLTHVKSKIVNLTEVEKRLVVPVGWGAEERGGT